ncbi:2TM domain-containing protein [Phenylobacterium sp.]|uniref:2TM domain-containing protein n=1 Tax=Phenylobacterium sp. TaxID=1871053 RepID=UPI001218FF64|nr:2TM domain-containing protein [Phenylobacterium sp.]THD54876.1 MAG: 2TM domain-containing protein [Phenylobacterium sp.]
MTDDLELRRQAERRADVKLGFRAHVFAYVLVNAGLVAVNLVTSPGYFWAIWPIFGWGLGLVAHGVAVYHFASNMREQAVEAELRRLREGR